MITGLLHIKQRQCELDSFAVASTYKIHNKVRKVVTSQGERRRLPKAANTEIRISCNDPSYNGHNMSISDSEEDIHSGNMGQDDGDSSTDTE